jgi:hypothetical protein
MQSLVTFSLESATDRLLGASPHFAGSPYGGLKRSREQEMLEHTWFDVLIKSLAGVLLIAMMFVATLELMDAFSPLLDRRASYSITVSEKPAVCATGRSQIVFEGKICQVSGSTIYVLWDSLANLSTSDPACGDGKYIKWNKSDYLQNQHWVNTYLGVCGRRPDYFEQMPASFHIDRLNVLP